MSCKSWRVVRRPEYLEDLDAIAAWIARDNRAAAVDLWLLIDEQVDRLTDPNFPRRISNRVADAYELVAHENYIVYFDQNERDCTLIVRAVVHVARQFPE
ncbi:MAG: type II toxin-antitoxin system RelE/ParE family toxin [Comamonadaceae bacterium CG_4_9_14_3_um_filter_60_33]|nr:MAG: type II toxin-antitoxin system RelE/ParE family toxin [Comamonadaceae bacterium CG_4_10_14_3_um_filter_60_42]PJB45933.1 MAG: type II toxin-antitoxin system RelE/ParE family toxin [Comamonadaceae bacterium CG_4_9_14_3_um_filter_60_33]